jgi:hypothetical protein
MPTPCRVIAFAIVCALGIIDKTAAEPIKLAELHTALSSAQGGDRIELAGGDYGSLDISGVNFTSDVTIVSADPSDPAVITRLELDNSSHLVLDGLVFSGGKSKVTDSSYITVRNSVFAGTLDADGYGTGKGLQFAGSDHIVVEQNEFYHWKKAMGIGSSSDVQVLRNKVHSCNNDAFNFNALNRLLVEGNWIHDFNTAPGVGHNDMIQTWNPDPENPIKDVTIRGNFLDAGTGDKTHAILMRNGKAEKDPTNLDVYYRNVLIEDNVIYTAHSNGINIGETIGLTIRNNTLLRDRHVDSDKHHAPKIKLARNSQDVVVVRNIAHKVDWANLPRKWVINDNLGVQDNTPYRANYYGNLFVNALARGANLNDLRAVPGGLIESLGAGAEMTRTGADITLQAGPAAIASR